MSQEPNEQQSGSGRPCPSPPGTGLAGAGRDQGAGWAPGPPPTGPDDQSLGVTCETPGGPRSSPELVSRGGGVGGGLDQAPRTGSGTARPRGSPADVPSCLWFPQCRSHCHPAETPCRVTRPWLRANPSSPAPPLPCSLACSAFRSTPAFQRPFLDGASDAQAAVPLIPFPTCLLIIMSPDTFIIIIN